jgi:type III secretory pathway component EscV
VSLPPAATYTLQRLALFGGTVVFSAAVLRGVPFIGVLAIAAIVSGILSYFLLARSRAGMAQAVAGKVTKLSERIDASAAAEDEALDSAQQVPPKPE